MNRFLTLVLALAAALLTGCAHAPGSDFRKRTNRIEDFTFRTKGDPGQAFTAILSLDGTERRISGVSPAQYSFSACVLTGTITRTGGNGSLSFEIVSSNALVGFGAPKGPVGRCRVRYHDRGIEVWQ